MHNYGPIYSTTRSVRASGRLHEVSDKSREYHSIHSAAVAADRRKSNAHYYCSIFTTTNFCFLFNSFLSSEPSEET